MKIYSSFDQIVPASTQNAISNAAANCGVDSVSLRWANENTDDKPIYDAYENENYLFSVDTDGDVIFER